MNLVGPQPRFEKYTPLRIQSAEILEVAGDHPEMRSLWSRSRGSLMPKFDKFYRFHNDYNHDTNQCFHYLKDDIERLIQTGHLKEYMYRQGSRGQKQREPEGKTDDREKQRKEEAERGPQLKKGT